MLPLTFICAQPATRYYAWQVEVMLQNFQSVGIPLDSVQVVVATPPSLSLDWQLLSKKYSANFFFYQDTRVSKFYPSSIRPNILAQHFKQNRYLQDCAIFYHDCDIAFTKPLDFSPWLQDTETWYGSDTRSYIGHEYIVSKGQDILNAMCTIVDIDPNIILQHEYQSIGAQYVMKQCDHTLWEMVERNSETLFIEINKLSVAKQKVDPTYHELQIWCADMWALLWEAWKRGFTTLPHPYLNFAWATSPISEWDNCNIYHNAGAVDAKSGLFYKGDYITRLPYQDILNIDCNFASSKYWELIQSVNTVLRQDTLLGIL